MKEKREEQGLSLPEASKLAEISHVHIKDIVGDKIKPTFEKITNLLNPKNTDTQEFLTEAAKKYGRNLVLHPLNPK